MKHPLLHLALAASFLPAFAATPQEELRTAVEARFLGDRTGACIAAAIVGDRPATAFVCADPKNARKLDDHATFEIGSVAKTMVSALVAELILKGEASLEDPLAKFLPKGTKVPDFQGHPITLGHILSHRSGLPSLPGRMHPALDANPYASLTPEELLGSLEDVKLEAAPGTTYHYSNFAMMVLSYALARRSGQDLQTLLAREVFKPLDMQDAHITREAGREAEGHLSNGRPAPAWDFPVDMAGAGGVRASLSDLVHYVEGELGTRKSAITAALRLTQDTLVTATPPAMAMNWVIIPLKNRNILLHEGGTAGFSSLVALDPENHQGVVLLSDTSLTNVGGLIPLGLSLLDVGAPPAGFPHRTATPGELVVSRMVGRFVLPGGQKMFVERRDGRLFAQAEGEPSLELGYDSTGDFYALDRDLIIHPLRTPTGFTFVLRQGGGQIKAERLLTEAMDEKALQVYTGLYKVATGFSLKVFTRGPQLVVQGAGQQETPVEATDKEVFSSETSGAEFTFVKDAKGKVTSVLIRQNGKTLKADKH